MQALRGEISREQAVESIKQNSRRYAKRQLTWFKRYADALRIDWQDEPEPEQTARRLTAEGEI